MNRIEQFLRVTKEHGVWKSSWSAIRFTLRKCLGIDWKSAYILTRPVDKQIRSIDPKIDANIRLASKDDLQKLKKVVDDDKYATFKTRFDNGRICHIAVHRNHIAAYSWISFHGEYETSLQFTIEENTIEKEGYLFDVFVMPEFRNNRIQTRINIDQIKYCRDKGCSVLKAVIQDNNEYSLKSFFSNGFVPDKSILLLKIFGMKFHKWKNIDYPEKIVALYTPL